MPTSIAKWNLALITYCTKSSSFCLILLNGKPEFGQRHHIIDGRTIVENTLVIKDGVKQNVTTYKKPPTTAETCVAVFHGRPNPEQCTEDPLVGDNWKI